MVLIVYKLYDNLKLGMFIGMLCKKPYAKDINPNHLFKTSRREMGNHVFVCYAREDEAFVLKLAARLKNLGVPIWLDQWDIPSGADWDLTIDNALYDCAQFLIVLSETSVKSLEVRSELRTVLDEKKPIVPILYQSCRIPRQLRLIQRADFTSCSPDDVVSLNQVLKALGMGELDNKIIQEQLAVPDEKIRKNFAIMEKLEEVRDLEGDPLVRSRYEKSIQNCRNKIAKYEKKRIGDGLDYKTIRERIAVLEKNIRNNYDILKELEVVLRLEDDPKVTRKYKNDIQDCRKRIAEYEKEFEDLRRIN